MRSRAVASIRTFTGRSFQAPDSAQPLLVLPDDSGEAAMFTAQRSGNERNGMNAALAARNFQFVLNVMHWLSGILS